MAISDRVLRQMEQAQAFGVLVDGLSPVTKRVVKAAIERMIAAGHGLDETYAEYREAARNVERLSAYRESKWCAETQAYYDALAEENRLASRIDGLRRILGGLQ